MPQVWINYGLLYNSRSRFHWLLLISASQSPTLLTANAFYAPVPSLSPGDAQFQKPVIGQAQLQL